MDPEALKNYPTKESLIKMVKEVDEKDKNREVAPLIRAKDAIYYDNTQSPVPEQDAIVLWYYITHSKEIISNCELLNGTNN